ncbi:MAG TPA: phosphoglycolate phosphatase [Candidatus Nitrosocosmicus sp.]|nr:phosphoglycolate phosphatase [Candidatus Nitrosocosmicus sp.]
MRYLDFYATSVIISVHLNKIRWLAIDIDGTITVNGNGMVNLEALSKLRFLVKLGYKVIYVTGRSSLEAFSLAVFGGTTQIAIGENGGVISTSPIKHEILASREKCKKGLQILENHLENVSEKPVFPRMSEIVLERSFDIKKANQLFREKAPELTIVDSQYAFHINESNINKGTGLEHLMKSFNIKSDGIVTIGDSITDVPMFKKTEYSITFENSESDVQNNATFVVKGSNGEGLVNAINLIVCNKV